MSKPATGQDGRTAIVEPVAASSLVITIPDTPSRDLSPNGRVHHMRKHRAAQAARKMAWATALHHVGESPRHRPAWRHTAERVRVDWLVRWGKGRKVWDDDNLVAGLKPFQDGLCDALGIDDRRFRLGTVSQDRDPEGRGEIVVTLSDATGS